MELLTQTEARREAKTLNNQEEPFLRMIGQCNIAQPVPAESWGGHELGWTVALVPCDWKKDVR